MDGRIFIEADDAEYLGLPVGAKHLYLVHRDDDGAEYVIRSGPDNSPFPFFTEMEVEANVPMHRSADDRDGETPAERGSTELVFGVGTDAAWAMMVKYARLIAAADYPYSLLEENSNAFIGAMVHAAGGDPLAMRPRGVSTRDALGLASWDEIVDDLPPPADAIFRGSARADEMTGLQVGEDIDALGGGDAVRAGRGNDVVRGGGGDDRLFGQYGADRLDGGGGNDRLVGGAGGDVLVGGAGRNVLIGAAGADVFVFGGGPGRHRIDDFQDAIDLIRINPGAAGYDDLVISSFGASGQHTRVAFADTVIELRDLDRGRLDRADFDFAAGFDGLA